MPLVSDTPYGHRKSILYQHEKLGPIRTHSQSNGREFPQEPESLYLKFKFLKEYNNYLYQI